MFIGDNVKHHMAEKVCTKFQKGQSFPLDASEVQKIAKHLAAKSKKSTYWGLKSATGVNFGSSKYSSADPTSCLGSPNPGLAAQCAAGVVLFVKGPCYHAVDCNVMNMENPRVGLICPMPGNKKYKAKITTYIREHTAEEDQQSEEVPETPPQPQIQTQPPTTLPTRPPTTTEPQGSPDDMKCVEVTGPGVNAHYGFGKQPHKSPEDAEKECKQYGMTLAPIGRHPAELENIVAQNPNKDKPIWVNAKKVGCHYRWGGDRNGPMLKRRDPRWCQPGHRAAKSEKCVVLTPQGCLKAVPCNNGNNKALCKKPMKVLGTARISV